MSVYVAGDVMTPIPYGTDAVPITVTDSTGATVMGIGSVTFYEGPLIVPARPIFYSNEEGVNSFFTALGDGLNETAAFDFPVETGVPFVMYPPQFFGPTANPRPGTYRLSVTATQTTPPLTLTQIVTVVVIQDLGPTSIEFVQNGTLSTSLWPGYIVGQANATDPDNTYIWSIIYSGSGTSPFRISDFGTLSFVTVPTVAGNYVITIECTDFEYSFQHNFTVPILAGTTLPSSDMTAPFPTDLSNRISSGTLATPTVTGITGTVVWYLVGPGVPNPLIPGEGGRYSINPSTGVITIIGPLSYQYAADGHDARDVLTIHATDMINTCSLTQTVSVAAYTNVRHPIIYVGPPDVLAAAGKTGFPSLTAAFQNFGANYDGFPTDFPPGITFVVYPSRDRTYYTVNDGGVIFSDFGNQDGGKGEISLVAPATIMGAPGETFPYFTGMDYFAKACIVAYSFDLTLENLEIGFVSGGMNGDLDGVQKDAGQFTGNLTINNCYIHDCDDGIARGCPGAQIFITNTRISHCGVGVYGMTHNIYVLGDYVYANNISSDQSWVGHLFKSRAQNTIILNSRFIDGELGCASNIIDIPNGGISNISGCLLHKGPNSQNGGMVLFANPFDQAGTGINPEAGQYNTLTVSNNTFVLDPGAPGPGNIMAGMPQYTADQANVFCVVNASFPGALDGLPASVVGTSNQFYGIQTTPTNNETLIQNASPTGTIAMGSINLTLSTVLTAHPVLDLSFPGPGPDPTIADPPGPFTETWLAGSAAPNQFGTGGGQLTTPVDTILVEIGTPAGTVVTAPAWSPGNSTLVPSGGPMLIWEINYQSGPNSFEINSSTGAISLSSAAVAQTTQADVIGVTLSQVDVVDGQRYIWNFFIVTYS
jgi:hypothetical protein